MSSDFFDFDGISETERRREKDKARQLRKSRWWQQKCSQGRCFYCGRPVKFKQLTMDHVVPLTMGGRSTKDNLVPACKSCNSKKQSMMPIEWQEYLDGQK